MTDQSKLQDIARKIVELKRFSLSTGVIVNRSVTTLIRDLNAQDLVIVSTAVNAALDGAK